MGKLAALAWGVSLLLSASGAASAAPRFTPKMGRAIDAAATEQVASGRTAGLAVQVVEHGKVVFSKGYGKADLEWNAAVTPDTVFRIASNTKSFTAAAILVLAQQGKLSLDDKLSKYLPEFPRGDEVTIRNLLNHTSGIANYASDYPDQRGLNTPRSTVEMVALISGLKPNYYFDPGTRWRYSNSGYYLLGYIVERVSGQSLQDFMAANLFEAAGLSHTAMDRFEDVVAQRAAGYSRSKTQPGAFLNAVYIPHEVPGPAGGLRSTVGDLTRWYGALFGGRILAPEWQRLVTEPGRLADGRLASEVRDPAGSTPEPQYDYGFGVEISTVGGHRKYWHGGAIDGFASRLATYPDDQVTIAVLVNTGGGLGEFPDQVESVVLGLPAPPKN